MSANAVVDARVLAEQIARKSNVQLGRVVSMTENQSLSSYAYNGAIAGIAGRLEMETAVIGGLQVGNQQLAINSRRVEFSVSVYAVFAIQ